jgi:hypothetical protein
MSVLAASPAHRTRVLRALGVVPWRRRAVLSEDAQPLPVMELPPSTRIVVVLPSGCAVRELDLVGRALCAFGPSLARAARIEVSDAMQVPLAQAYLVFGEAQAHALGRALPASAMRDAHIVLADAPHELLVQAVSKRRLWHALRSMRRALAATGAA